MENRFGVRVGGLLIPRVFVKKGNWKVLGLRQDHHPNFLLRFRKG